MILLKLTYEVKCMLKRRISMSLREYLFYNHITLKDFSEKTGISKPYISMIMKGKCKPSKRIMKDIIIATEGRINAENICREIGKGAQSELSINTHSMTNQAAM